MTQNKDAVTQRLQTMNLVVLVVAKAMQAVHKLWLEDLLANSTIKLCRTVSDTQLEEQSTINPDYLARMVIAAYAPWTSCLEAGKARFLASASTLLTYLIDTDSIEIGISTDATNTETEKKVLVTYSANWADEINVKGSEVWTEAAWLALVAAVDNAFTTTNNGYFRLTNYVGTNQEIEYRNFRRWRNHYTVKEITDVEAAVLEQYKTTLRGNFWVPDYLGEDEDEDEGIDENDSANNQHPFE